MKVPQILKVTPLYSSAKLCYLRKDQIFLYVYFALEEGFKTLIMLKDMTLLLIEETWEWLNDKLMF
jgi:hypothetical protein